MTLTELIRRENAVQSYDFWLDLRGVRRKQRRALVKDLRANLTEAAADVGMTRALFGIGSPKQLAHQSAPRDPARPRWNSAAFAALITFAFVVLGMQWAVLNAVNGVLASGVTGRDVVVDLFPWLGADTTVHVQPGGAGFSASGALDSTTAAWMLIPAAVVFLVVAQPWRLLRRSAGSHLRTQS